MSKRTSKTAESKVKLIFSQHEHRIAITNAQRGVSRAWPERGGGVGKIGKARQASTPFLTAKVILINSQVRLPEVSLPKLSSLCQYRANSIL